MLQFNATNYLVQTLADLDGLPLGGSLYLDFETTSGDKALDSLNPWHNCSPIGFAYTVDDDPRCWFVPWPRIEQGFLVGLFKTAKQWINQNVKYDAHVITNTTNWPDLVPAKLVDTILLAHLIDADRSYKGGYSLDTLCLHWLGIDLSRYYKSLRPYLYDHNGRVCNKDYGRIPIDILADYATAQVQANRQLHKFCVSILPPECQATGLLDIEIDLTRVLWQIERNGLHIDPSEVHEAEQECLLKMLCCENLIEQKLGYGINPDSNPDLFDVICNRYGQPVLKWTNVDKDGNQTDKSGPSFDKDTLAEYRERIETPDELKYIVRCVEAYRHERQHRSLFYIPWQRYAVPDGKLSVIHSNHNQNLKSGRMSCSEPNDQQLDKRAKQLIKPKPGYLFVSFDQSQIEYRVAVHYLNNRKAIEAYLNNPDTDFHELVRIWCEIEKRKPAKTINFLTMFRGGKKKITVQLARNFHEMGIHLDAAGLMQKATAFYEKYHRNLPELKDTAKRAENIARQRGYVLTIGGRRCHLPGVVHNIWIGKKGQKIDKCHIAISRVIQGSAADLYKDTLVRLETADDSPLKEIDGHVIASVHDEYLLQILDNFCCEWALIEKLNEIREYLENSKWKLRVPLRVDGGYSRKNWADCDSDAYCDVASRKGGGRLTRKNDWSKCLSCIELEKFENISRLALQQPILTV